MNFFCQSPFFSKENLSGFGPIYHSRYGAYPQIFRTGQYLGGRLLWVTFKRLGEVPFLREINLAA
jgi:hypothetical protein